MKASCALTLIRACNLLQQCFTQRYWLGNAPAFSSLSCHSAFSTAVSSAHSTQLLKKTLCITSLPVHRIFHFKKSRRLTLCADNSFSSPRVAAMHVNSDECEHPRFSLHQTAQNHPSILGSPKGCTEMGRYRIKELTRHRAHIYVR